MDIITNRKYDHVKVASDKGSIVVDDNHIIPVGDSPLPISDGLNIISGWPLRGMYPNRLYESRIEIDSTLLGEDLSIGNGKIYVPFGLKWDDDMNKYYSVSTSFNISNLKMVWDSGIPECTISIDDYQDSILLTNINQTNDSYYVYDNGTNLTDPTAAILTNHYIVKYAALDRGYGIMKHGWFYADTTGTWSWSVDGNDVVEIVIDEGVVTSKYTNSGTVGMGVLNGDIDLVAGWHHLFAYTSDRSDISKPYVWFKRPGDVDWTTLSNNSSDGIIWNRSYLTPEYIELQSNAGNITASAHYSEDDKALITFDSTLFNTGNVSISVDTLPRYRTYYDNNWIESEIGRVSEPASLPPRFENIRAILSFNPISEIVFYPNELPYQDFVPKFLISPAGSSDWYKWNGTSFETVSVSSISDLITEGNTLYDVNHIPEEDWESFLNGTYCRLMFTGDTPLVMVYNQKIFTDISNADYMIGTKSHLSANMRLQRRSI